VEFTAHNVILPDGSETLPGVTPVAETGICRSALRTLAMGFPDGPEGVKVADLGCLEGGYAAEFARAGYDVTGVEVRAENIACCREVAAALKLPGLRFAQADVRDWVTSTEPVDAVFCSGLLYHLEAPAAFLTELGRVTRRLVILQTHFADSPNEEHEGYRGRWYGEGEGRWASWGNPQSFWLAKPDLLAAVSAAGFSVVLEQHDYLGHIAGGTYRDMFGEPQGADRGMFIGVKP
jgi:SAM-dependent methyltransferase